MKRCIPNGKKRCSRALSSSTKANQSTFLAKRCSPSSMKLRDLIQLVSAITVSIKLPVGNCVKSPKLLCKFTELPCFHCPAYVLTPEDLPALEIYEQQLLERVEIGKQANNTYWIEINQKNLEERVRPAMALLKQGQIVAKSTKNEREYTPEEWEQQQHNAKAGEPCVRTPGYA